MTTAIRLMTAILGLLTVCTAFAQESASDSLARQVEDTERAFARTMADRDFEGFTAFLAEEAVFFSGKTPLRGKQRVAETWKAYFEGPEAPFSWGPELVVVLDSGTLAHSSGPVRDPAAIASVKARYEVAGRSLE